MNRLEHFLHYIDRINEKIGQGVSFLLIPIAIITIIEVILRYIFNKPTLWVWDTNLQIFGIVILLGVGYTLLHDRHVRVEVIMTRVPPKVRLFLELLAMLMLMYVAAELVWQGGINGWESFVNRERLNTIWAPPIFQIKMLYPIAGILLFFQCVAKIIRELQPLFKGKV